MIKEGPSPKKYFGYTTKEWGAFVAYPFLKAAAVPFSQPLAKVGAVQNKSVRSTTGPLNMWKASQQVLQKQGVKGLWDGTVIGMTRESTKGAYKGYLQVASLDIADFFVSDDHPYAHFFKGFIAGALTGAGDGFISTPMERYKNFKLTQEGSTNLFSFLSKIYHEQPHSSFVRNMNGVANEMYRGLSITTLKQSVMGIAFFSTNAWSQVVVAPYEKEHPYASMAFSCFASGVGAATVGAPLKLVQTLIHQNTGKDQPKESALSILRKVKAQQGWKGVMTGAPAQALLIIFGYSINSLFVNVYKKTFRSSGPSHPPRAPANPSQDAQHREIEQGDSAALNELTNKMRSLTVEDEGVEIDLLLSSYPTILFVENGEPLRYETTLSMLGPQHLEEASLTASNKSVCRM